jgi:hypothetical protein
LISCYLLKIPTIDIFRKDLFRSFLWEKESPGVWILWEISSVQQISKMWNSIWVTLLCPYQFGRFWSLIRLGYVLIVDLEIDLVDYVVHLYSALSGVASGLPLVWASCICDVDFGCQPCGKIERSRPMGSRSSGFGRPSYGKFGSDGVECQGKGSIGKMVRRVFWPKLQRRKW